MLMSTVKPTFKLSNKFLEKFQGQQPEWGFGDLSYFTYKRTYARIDQETGQQEEFVDTLTRVVNGCYQAQEKHIKSIGLFWDTQKAQRSAQEMFTRMWDFKFLPPGRGLWMMGTQHVENKGAASLQNCAFVSTKEINRELADPFAWAMDMLMLGVGVGFDTKGAGLVKIKKPLDTRITIIISDDREGWVDSVRQLINSYEGTKAVDFDYSLIRLKGAPIKGFGGTASGPEPLIELHNSIRLVLDGLIDQFITSVAIVDIENLIGKCVVAGNVRRSAELAIGDIEDKDYVTMKDFNLHPNELQNHRWASNNSVFANSFSDFKSISESILLNGEPGLIFLDNCRHYGRLKDGFIPIDDRRYDNVDGLNPCSEQQLEHKESCNLVETFPSRHETVEDYFRTLKFAYLYAKSVTLIPTHDETTNAIINRNRRIGTSMSGIQQAMNKFGKQNFLNNFCDKGYSVLKKWDRIYSRWLGVPESIRLSTVKPSGTTSLLAGVWPGVHFTHAEQYFRTVRLAASSNFLQPLLDANYRVEFSYTSADKLSKALRNLNSNIKAEEILDIPVDLVDRVIVEEFGRLNGDVVVYFGIQEQNFEKSKFDISLWEQLATVREMQTYWSDNAVSCTITVKQEEQKDLVSAIEYAAPYAKSLSFLPLTNHGFKQAPYTDAYREEVEIYLSQIKTLDLSGKSNMSITGSKFCSNDSCEI